MSYGDITESDEIKLRQLDEQLCACVTACVGHIVAQSRHLTEHTPRSGPPTQCGVTVSALVPIACQLPPQLFILTKEKLDRNNPLHCPKTLHYVVLVAHIPTTPEPHFLPEGLHLYFSAYYKSTPPLPIPSGPLAPIPTYLLLPLHSLPAQFPPLFPHLFIRLLSTCFPHCCKKAHKQSRKDCPLPPNVYALAGATTSATCFASNKRGTVKLITCQQTTVISKEIAPQVYGYFIAKHLFPNEIS
ncbi:hypothetical protein J6590_017125 [Homalodisca vitripennis]|nr:hypothetical protein J6590_017125 [Homalodisca vitripennis]